MINNNRTILFYDGQCGFCNKWVEFVIKNESLPPQIKFCSLDSNFAREHFQANNFVYKVDSILLFSKGKYHSKSEAILRLFSFLKQAFRLLQIGKLLPLTFRDYLYDVVGKNRYALVKKNASCAIPTHTNRNRFLDA